MSEQYVPQVAINYINGKWTAGRGPRQPVLCPATGERIAEICYSTADDVKTAVAAARAALSEWQALPLPERMRYIFAIRERLYQAAEDLARVIVVDEGKTLDDARGEVKRALENVEVACATPMLMMGQSLNSVGPGIDCTLTYHPVGVSAIIGPFNFPLMVPLWFLPYALACGNTVVVKPSEQVPLAMQAFLAILDNLGLPPGVVNMVQGGRETVEALVSHPDVDSVSFVGSEPVARSVYQMASQTGKRVQCLAGAKNYLVVLPDADVEAASRAVVSSAFGAAGERCLAGSILVLVGESGRLEQVLERTVSVAEGIRVGNGLDPEVDMGPLISEQHRRRVVEHVRAAVSQGARLVLDGRRLADRPGYFLGPTILDEVTVAMDLSRTEVFGPVLGVMRTATLDEALEAITATRYGNASSIFTCDGRSARKFSQGVPCGMVGVNVGIPAPLAYFPFTGWRNSFFGDLHAQGLDSIRFFTRPKVVISRWSD